MRTAIDTVTGTLGEGGMGVVYAAHDERLGRPVETASKRCTGMGVHRDLKPSNIFLT